jgi:hypothetical protein
MVFILMAVQYRLHLFIIMNIRTTHPCICRRARSETAIISFDFWYLNAIRSDSPEPGCANNDVVDLFLLAVDTSPAVVS